MTQEEKNLLLRDLCARLPYGFTIYRLSDNANIKINDIDDFAHFLEYSDGEEFKPYLRPMSSMTEEELIELNKIGNVRLIYSSRHSTYHLDAEIVDYLVAHHFDYRGLISKGLALEAPEDMCKTE